MKKTMTGQLALKPLALVTCLMLTAPVSRDRSSEIGERKQIHGKDPFVSDQARMSTLARQNPFGMTASKNMHSKRGP